MVFSVALLWEREAFLMLEFFLGLWLPLTKKHQLGLTRCITSKSTLDGRLLSIGIYFRDVDLKRKFSESFA